MKLSKLNERTTTTTLEIDGDTLTVTVRPYLMTPERERLMIEGENEDRYYSLLNFFVEYVVDWDLEDDEGTQVALTAESVERYCPSAVLLFIMQEAKEATNPLGRTSSSKGKR